VVYLGWSVFGGTTVFWGFSGLGFFFFLFEISSLDKQD